MADGIDAIAPEIAIYLRGERIGFRAPTIADTASANVWMLTAADPFSGAFTFPTTPAVAEKVLRKEETTPWGNADTIRLVAVELETNEIIGGAVIARAHGRTGWIRSQVAAWMEAEEIDRLECEMASLLIRFVREEVDLMVVEYVVAADREPLIERILGEGFREVARLREAILRPAGRADLLWLESINPAWGSRIVASEEVR